MISTNLIVVTTTEMDTFLRVGRLAKRERLLEPCRVFDVDSCSLQKWHTANPEIIVGGWAMEALVDEDNLLPVVLSTNLQVGLDVCSVEPPTADNSISGWRNVTLLPHPIGPTTVRHWDTTDFRHFKY